MFSLISSAQAQDIAQAAGEPSLMANLFPLIIIFAIMYFLMIRPQQKRVKAHREMINAVRVNDAVVTAGGIIGKVIEVNDEKAILSVEIADGVVVKINRATISEVLEKEAAKSALKDASTPAKKSPAKKKPSNKKAK